jgi:hypothetical protein
MAHSIHRARAVVVAVDDEAVRCMSCKNRIGSNQGVRLSDGVVGCRRCAAKRQVFPAVRGRGAVEFVG